MDAAIYFKHIKETPQNKQIIKAFEKYSRNTDNTTIYLLNTPLGEMYDYDYKENVIVVLSPGYRIIFLNLDNTQEEQFKYYCQDFISDVGHISSKFNYQNYIGRTREWEKDFTKQITLTSFDSVDVAKLLNDNALDTSKRRKSELIISLITGCINDIDRIGVEQPQSLIEKIKKKIILFDGEQTRFVYRDFPIKKIISVQGLSGTGKTELLLHKLKDLYLKDDDTKIFFTCHNIALSKKLQDRVPHFFDFMQVQKQIKWNDRLWIKHAWGSHINPNSGFYSYICNYYNLGFYQYSKSVSYDFIFRKALEEINKIPVRNFKPCFDYILVDESQDFPDVFFDLCKKVVKHKVYIAGDVFQDIFDSLEKKPRGVDIVLNRCYRTDPHTLMFAHAMGLGLYEPTKLNWYDKKGWERMGYVVKEDKKQNICRLSRLPISRFDDVDFPDSVEIKFETTPKYVCSILRNLITETADIKPEDIAIILVDQSKNIYNYIDNLCLEINKTLNLPTVRGYESKKVEPGSIYITNSNNVKGLEFPYVICVTQAILDTYKYRNTLYTMLTRSFIKSFLLVTDKSRKQMLEDAWIKIKSQDCIETPIPTPSEISQIRNKNIEYVETPEESFDDIVNKIFEEQGITNIEIRKKIIASISNASFDKFDKELLNEFVSSMKKFF